MRLRPFLLYLAILAAALSPTLPARAEVPEKEDLRTTLSNLLPQLKKSYEEALKSDSLLVDNSTRRQQISEMVRSADDVTVKVYTQRQGLAIDMAIALEEVSRVSGSLREQARLSDKYLASSRAGLRRYSLLGRTLRDMYTGPQMDSLVVADSLLLSLAPLEQVKEENPEEKALLDSCLSYIETLTTLYGQSVLIGLQDSVSFAETGRRLQQAYDYAQANYAATQKNIFIGGNVNIVQIIRNWDTFIAGVRDDLQARFLPTESMSEDTVRDFVPMSGGSILTYTGLSLLALLLAFIVAFILVGVILRIVRREDVKEFQPILSAILAIPLFVLGAMLLNGGGSNPYWRMAFGLLSQFAWLTLAIFISLLVRIKGPQARPSRNIYVPTLLLAFMNILLRAMFLPASIVPLILPPGLLLFAIWQSSANYRYRKQVDRTDLRYMWTSVVMMAVACILSLAGYSMVGVFLLTFWFFQLSLLHTITMLFYLMQRYYATKVTKRKARYHEENPYLPLGDKDAFIEVTWLYDLLRMVVVPIVLVLSVPLSVKLVSQAYQLSLTGVDFMRQPIFHGDKFATFTVLNFLIIICLFFIFRYLIYLFRGMARIIKLRSVLEKRKTADVPLKESDVNLSLSFAIISLLSWLIYLIIVFTILHISSDAFKTIMAGLAAGVGFALKDLINNFFYGVQLMAGRIRVGDKISCDGIRGIVKRVSYQTTLVEDEDGSLIAFTNTDLFSKKFKNLNSGKNYEFLKMPVSVKYGTDIAKARQVILDALKPLMTLDKSGRDIVDPSFPIDVRFDSFGDSSVNLIVALYSTVETHYTFPSRAKEAIYNAFKENGIEIPFPQQDVYVKSVPESGKGL